jgi:hypothetical protein
MRIRVEPELRQAIKALAAATEQPRGAETLRTCRLPSATRAVFRFVPRVRGSTQAGPSPAPTSAPADRVTPGQTAGARFLHNR